MWKSLEFYRIFQRKLKIFTTILFSIGDWIDKKKKELQKYALRVLKIRFKQTVTWIVSYTKLFCSVVRSLKMLIDLRFKIGIIDSAEDFAGTIM